MIKIIELIVQPDGRTKAETKGFSGADCREASRFIEQALGQRTGEQLTSEFHQAATIQQAAQEGS